VFSRIGHWGWTWWPGETNLLVFDWHVAVGCDSWSHWHPPLCDVHESFQGSTKKRALDGSCKDFWMDKQLWDCLHQASSGQWHQLTQSSCKSMKLTLIGLASMAKLKNWCQRGCQNPRASQSVPHSLLTQIWDMTRWLEDLALGFLQCWI